MTRKFTIIGFTVGLLIVATLLFWHDMKHPSDAAIRQKLPGTWVFIGNGGRSTCTRDSNGHFTAQLTGRRVARLDGTWQVEHGFLIDRVTNSSWTKNVPYTMSTRIIHIDDHKLVVQVNRNLTVSFTKGRAMMPNTALDPPATAP